MVNQESQESIAEFFKLIKPEYQAFTAHVIMMIDKIQTENLYGKV